MRRTDPMNPAVIPVRRSLHDPGLWFIALTLAVTTLLHYLTDIRLIPSYSIYRSLFYVPIAVAAVREVGQHHQEHDTPDREAALHITGLYHCTKVAS